MTRLEFNNQVLLLSRKLYIVAFRLLRRQDEAEDAVQEVFIKLWNRIDELGKYNSLEAYAVTTIKNYCIDMLRKGKSIVGEENPSHFNVMNNDPSPHEELENNETSQLLGRIIDNLPEMYRDIIRLKDIDGLSYDEVAEIADQNINTLRVNISRARKMIRDEFKRNRYEYRGNLQASREVL
ncbi:MAG TPA: sigma-70 family RNA polymerase sigma factor [Bacteroidales bacterium]|nr:sigma-70 family RNA polymerase sigma factor [Bacteroidales bacterium]